MVHRPQLTNLNTCYDSTRYEVEFWSLGEYWALDMNCINLEQAKERVAENTKHYIQSRIIVVSESRRIVP